MRVPVAVWGLVFCRSRLRLAVEGAGLVRECVGDGRKLVGGSVELRLGEWGDAVEQQVLGCDLAVGDDCGITSD